MIMKHVAIATEDELSEQVAVTLALEAGLTPYLRLRQGGFGYLKKNLDKWCEMAMRGIPVVLLTDLDRSECAPSFIRSWMGSRKHPQELLFRVAIREVEAWLLADVDGMRALLGRKALCPHAPDTLPDPKRYLLGLAEKAPRSMRNALVGERGAMACQGLEYNLVLCKFVTTTWDPERAAQHSPSLAQARRRLGELAGRLA